MADTPTTNSTPASSTASPKAAVSEAGLAASEGVTEAQYRSLEEHWKKHREVKPGYSRRLTTVGGETVAVYRKQG